MSTLETTDAVKAAPSDITEVIDAAVVDESSETAPRTAVPDAGDAPTGERRTVHGITFDDAFNLVGAGAASACVSTLLFGWLAPLTGVVGWLVLTYVLFIGIYVILTALRADRQEVADRVATVLFVSAGIVLLGALLFVTVYTLIRGSSALMHLNFFTQTMEVTGPLDPLSQGGVLHAIVGTLIQISIALAITIPLGLTTAVFLNEVGGRFARFVRTVVDAMTALPSVVAGLFIYAAIIQVFTHERNGFAASLAITVMMLPIVIRSADVVLRLVPGNLREASYALGSTHVQTVWGVVLPTARSGLVTALILGTARGIGETSPVLLTSGVTSALNLNPFEGPMISLPLAIFDLVKSPEPSMIARGFGTAAVLLILVLGLFVTARLLGGRGPGELSGRQRARAAAASRRDLARLSAADAARATSAGVPEFHSGGRVPTFARPTPTRSNPWEHR
jgi:phosphate transport system permease protein